ncbi:MAG: extracellular solute-binding protein [Anaerolineales bacterium]|nr:extracellular solute-binding protein [Anaerolineales bacterium]
MKGFYKIILVVVLLLGLMLVACSQTTPTPEPVETTTEVVEPTEPAAEMAEPTAEMAEPTAEVAEPTAEVAEPTAEVVEPTAEAVEPVEEMPEARADGLPVYTGEPVELRMGWWGNDDRAERTLAVIALFEAAYPEITVVGEPNGGAGDHFQILDTQLAADNAPDIIQFGGNWPDYQQYLEPLNDYLGEQLLIDTPETFDQAALVPATAVDGNLYAISLGTNTLVLAYNKTMIEAAGVDFPADNLSWEELIDYGRTLKASLPEGVAPFVDNSTNQANYLSYFYTQQGTPIWTLDDGGKSYATVDSAQAWLQMWADMRAEGLIPDADTTYTYSEDGPDSSALVAGNAVIALVWSNQVAAYQAAMTDELGMTTLPTGGEDAYAIQMSQYLAVNKDSANTEAAALFVNFFVTSPEAGAILETNRGVPSSPVVRQSISAQATPIDAAVYRIYDAVADRTVPQGPNLPNDQEFVNELELIGQQVAYGQSTVDEAAEALQALIERLAVK